MTFRRLFKWLVLLSLAAVFAALLGTGMPDGPAAWFGLILLLGWIGGPLASAYLLSSGDWRGRGRRVLFIYFLAAAAVTAWTFAMVWMSEASTAAIDLFFMPLYTWAGLIATALATAAATGWRPSLSGRDPPLPRQSPPPG